MWSPVHNVPHRDLATRSDFVQLSTGNGTALTLSDDHMVYVSDSASTSQTPAPARDVKIRDRSSLF